MKRKANTQPDLGYGHSVSNYFSNTKPTRSRDETYSVMMIPLRITPQMAARLGAYGDAHEMTPTQTARSLLETALSAWEQVAQSGDVT